MLDKEGRVREKAPHATSSGIPEKAQTESLKIRLAQCQQKL
jgi:hypothetical protein